MGAITISERKNYKTERGAEVRQYELKQYTHSQLSHSTHKQLSMDSEGDIYLIFDRTPEDVERARYLAQRVSEFGIDALPEEERREWFSEMKGFYNVSDLNRVEAACAQIAAELTQQDYSISLSVKQDWEMRDFPAVGELERIRENIQNLREVFFVRTDTPEVPESLKYMDIEKANAIEKILYDLHLLYTALMEMTAQVAGFELGGV